MAYQQIKIEGRTRYFRTDEVRNLREVTEGFIPLKKMRGELECGGKTYHIEQTANVPSGGYSGIWYVDCEVGAEPEVRSRGRIALDADQTPDLKSYR